jgi:hypothetical protein
MTMRADMCSTLPPNAFTVEETGLAR